MYKLNGEMLNPKDKNHITTFNKILVATKVLRNWYLLPIDKLGIKKEQVFHFKNGYKLICRGHSTDINEAVVIASDLEYPAKYLKLKDNDVVLDLGANIGSFVIYLDSLNRKVKYQGYAFEPFTENFNLLKRNVALNKIKKFQLEYAAISDIDGEVSLDIDKAYDAISITTDQNKQGLPPLSWVKQSFSANKPKIKSYKLSTFCKEHKLARISLIKMDIEGSEYEVVRKDYEFLKKNAERIILEYHYLSKENNRDFLLNLFKKDWLVEEVYRAGRNGVLYLERKK